MSKITGLENIRELYDMWSRPKVSVYQFEGLEVFGTKERKFHRFIEDRGQVESVTKELAGKNVPILGDGMPGGSWYHPDFHVPVEIDGIPVDVEFVFGGDSGGEYYIDSDGEVQESYGPNPRTPQFADFQGFVSSQTVDLTVSRPDGGMLKSGHIRDLVDFIRNGLPGRASGGEFFNVYRQGMETKHQFNVLFSNEHQDWSFCHKEFDPPNDEDWGFESDTIWIVRFWSFYPMPNRNLTPAEEALMRVHKSLRKSDRRLTAEEIRLAEKGELQKSAEEIEAKSPAGLLRTAIRQRDAKAEAERLAAEKKERELQESHKKLTDFLADIGDFVVSRSGSSPATIRDLWTEREDFRIILRDLADKQVVCLVPADDFEKNKQRIIKWAVDLGAKEPAIS